ncbi:MAG: VOC family protein [Bacteroidota bacterium]
MSTIKPFHLAIPVNNLEEARVFYRDILNCEEGRSAQNWVDFNFFGHQLVLHETKYEQQTDISNNHVDGQKVPIPHFGIVMGWDEFHHFAKMLQIKQVVFQVAPHVRFKDQSGEQITMFFYDISGNALEFKAFKNSTDLFEK